MLVNPATYDDGLRLESTSIRTDADGTTGRVVVPRAYNTNDS